MGVNFVTEWSSTWQLSLAVNKCSVLNVGTHATNQYRLGVRSLPICNTISDLGVENDNLLSFETHTQNMVSIANRRIYLIRRCFLSKDVSCLTKAYVVFVRPLRILFACLVSVRQIPCWLYRICSTSLYKIPTRFSSASYSERLKRLKFDTLELRRLYIDLTLCFKICNGYVALDKNDFFAFNPLSRTRGHRFKITVPNNRINARQHFFAGRVISAWNYLPTPVITAPSVCIFKKHVSEIDLNSLLTIKI